MTDFVHLHCHSMGSLLDGFSTPQEMVDRALDINQDAIAITDHGSMSATLEFYKYAKGKDIKPIIGVEAYLSDDKKIKEKDVSIYHIILLAKNNTGLTNLYRLSDIAWNKGFYRKPRIDFNDLNDHSEGLFCLSGCMNGVVAQAILNKDIKEAKERNSKLNEIFSDNYAIEIQPWNDPELNQWLIDIADHSGQTPLVVTIDAHYAYQEDKVAEEISLIIAQSSEFNEKEKRILEQKFRESRRITNDLERINYLHPHRKLRYDHIDNYIMTKNNIEKRMLVQGIDRQDIYDNTAYISSLCDVHIEFGNDYFPRYSKRLDSHSYIYELAMDNLDMLGLSDNPVYLERLQEELMVIRKLNFSDYFLVIWDMVHYAQDRGIRIGPGRGSVGGSLLAYVLGITKIDPIKHGLLFFRFLNIDIEYNPRFREMVPVG